MRKKVENFIVASAIEALVTFCEKYGVRIHPATIANFAIAWREGGVFEWTPCEPAFRRICTRPTEAAPGASKRVAVVFCRSEAPDPEKTKELNDLIFQYTRDRWDD